MKLPKKILFALALAASATSAFSQAPTWPEQSTETRPGARWWWLGSAVDDENITSLMKEYARVGLGTLEITPIYCVQSAYRGNHKPINYLSSNWFSALKKTQEVGKETGIQIDMNMGTGWPFGGPMVTIKEAAGKLEYSNATITSSTDNPIITFDCTPKANSELNCVMAFPSNIKDADGVNITKQIDTIEVTRFVVDNKLSWTPEHHGKWTLVAIFNGHTLQQVKRPAPGGEGYVLDHLDSAAVANYIAYFEKKFEDNGNPYPATFFNDSYEIFGADWSPRFFEEFEKRRGYKLQYHLQELLNLTSDKNTQVRSDYRETMADMYLDNFIKPWNDFAHRHGVKTRNQSHGSPSNLIDTYASVDIPEIEGYGMTDLNIKGLRKDDGFTAKNSSDFATLKLASSAAHVTGKKLTSSETFTWFTEHFRTSLSQMKPEMDLMFLAGVNRMFFHGTTYSPEDVAWPGYKFYASMDMSPTNSIWKDAPGFMKYVSRCQSFLQMGEPDNDILVYFPVYNSWHTKGTNWLKLCAISDFSSQYSAADKAVDSLKNYGYGTDYISDRMIQNLKVENGLLVTEGGAKYKALQIPVSSYMPAETSEKIEELKAEGATVITTYKNKADFSEIKPEPMCEKGLRFIRRKNDTGHHYFISNLTSEDIADYTKLAVGFQSAVLFNPVDSTMKQALVNENNEVYLSLRSGESVILQTYDYDVTSESLNVDMDTRDFVNTDIILDGSWTLEFSDAKLADASSFSKTYTMDKIQPWQTLDASTKQLMGTGTYTTTLNLSEEQINGSESIILDLGDVRESARVFINDIYAGCKWCVPFSLDCKEYLKPGNNTIRIDVTNLPANRISRMDRNGTVWRIFEDINISNISAGNNVGTTDTSFAKWTPVASGLNSEVVLHCSSPASTGIKNIASSENTLSKDWYTIQGIRIERPTSSGVFINGGRKVIVK